MNDTTQPFFHMEQRDLSRELCRISAEGVVTLIEEEIREAAAQGHHIAMAIAAGIDWERQQALQRKES